MALSDCNQQPENTLANQPVDCHKTEGLGALILEVASTFYWSM